MSLLCKAKALYIKTTVIQCGVPDYHGDVLDAEAVKRIFTSFNNQDSFDIHHNRLPVNDVSLLENYISKSDEEIAGTIVPTGSWNVVIRVDNPAIKQKILDGEIQGVSLTTAIKEECRAGLTKQGVVTYSEFPDAECWLPVFISLVTEPANLVGLHVMDYPVYIEKSKNHIHKFGGKTLSFLDKLKNLIAEEEASHQEPVITKSTGAEDEDVEVEASVDEKQEEDVVDKATEEETTTETIEEEVVEEDEVVEKAEDTSAEAEDNVEAEAESVEEAEVDLNVKVAELEQRIADLEALVNKAEPTTEDKPVEATTEDKVDDEPVITKSKHIEVTSEVNTTTNFYELSGRDPVTGKKIRSKNKVLN